MIGIFGIVFFGIGAMLRLLDRITFEFKRHSDDLDSQVTVLRRRFILFSKCEKLDLPGGSTCVLEVKKVGDSWINNLFGIPKTEFRLLAVNATVPYTIEFSSPSGVNRRDKIERIRDFLTSASKKKEVIILGEGVEYDWLALSSILIGLLMIGYSLI
ncbi:MAG: hypothetical protein KDD60_04125 [Bdellovibrionales bacterium]|nr:hypothetical protein [Bdellovibrionales bacterium]